MEILGQIVGAYSILSTILKPLYANTVSYSNRNFTKSIFPSLYIYTSIHRKRDRQLCLTLTLYLYIYFCTCILKPLNANTVSYSNRNFTKSIGKYQGPRDKYSNIEYTFQIGDYSLKILTKIKPRFSIKSQFQGRFEIGFQLLMFYYV